MARTTLEAREQILDDLAAAIDQLALAVACLGEAFELVAVDTADDLEAELFRPVQKAFGRAKRTHAQFAERCELPKHQFEPPSAGRTSQGPKAFVQRAVAASADAEGGIAELQDSMLPIEAGDAELRAGLGEVRELLAGVPTSARRFLSTLGR
jgi:hypothetical protein